MKRRSAYLASFTEYRRPEAVNAVSKECIPEHLASVNQAGEDAYDGRAVGQVL